MLMCPKCHDLFRKPERLNAHVTKCPGKTCKNCGKIGHLACGVSISGQELMERIKKSDKPITIIGMF